MFSLWRSVIQLIICNGDGTEIFFFRTPHATLKILVPSLSLGMVVGWPVAGSGGRKQLDCEGLRPTRWVVDLGWSSVNHIEPDLGTG